MPTGFNNADYVRELAATLRPGEGLLQHFDCNYAPCDCESHSFSVPCTVVGVVRDGVWRHLRCLECGIEWTARYEDLRGEP